MGLYMRVTGSKENVMDMGGSFIPMAMHMRGNGRRTNVMDMVRIGILMM